MTDTISPGARASSMPPILRIGTRGSPLALAQAHEVRDRLIATNANTGDAFDIEIVVIKTTGDRILDRPLAEIGGKGLFTKELDAALDDGSVDICVHSMKDVPTVLPDTMAIAAVLPREDPRDAWFSRTGDGIMALPAGSIVGTASLRRQAQVLGLRPDLRVVTLRGNVATRLSKLRDGQVDATLLALAGLNRLGQAAEATAVLDPEDMMPAVAQGAIGLQIRKDDTRTAARIAPLHCRTTGLCITMERAFLQALDGSCRTPIAGLAVLEGVRLTMRGLVASTDGAHIARIDGEADTTDPYAAGYDLGSRLRARLPAGILQHAGPDTAASPPRG